MESLLTFIVESIVDNPDAVQVDVGDRRGEPALVITVDKADRGAVIGRAGRTIRAIETVLKAASHGRPAPALEIAD